MKGRKKIKEVGREEGYREGRRKGRRELNYDEVRHK